MFAASVIAFREVLEICLIVSIVSASLSNIKNKKKIIISGILIGILFSIGIAVSFNFIGNAFEGIGQEILNIFIISLALICIIYTTILINQSSKSLSNKIETAKTQFNSIVALIALIICREGAELIIFLHGIYASGHFIENIIWGTILGSISGVVIAIILHNRLIKLPLKYFFKVITVFLVMLACNMASSLANLLHSANLINVLYKKIWDTSWLIDDNSLLGNVLYNLVGYSSRPTELQALFFFLTIILTSSLILYSKNKKSF